MKLHICAFLAPLICKIYKLEAKNPFWMNAEEMLRIKKTNKFYADRNGFNIILNIPDDCIYNVEEIKLVYLQEEDEWLVECNCVPESIKDNIRKFVLSYDSISDCIKDLEQSLNVVLSGKIPCIKNTASRNSKAQVLSKSFPFAINNHVTPNVQYTCLKKNISLLQCKNLNANIKCNKCNAYCVTASDASCSKCKNEIEISFVCLLDPEFLGFLQVKNGTFLAFAPSEFQFSCLSCNACYKTAHLGLSEAFRMNCFECHREICLTITKVQYISPAKKTMALKPGCELPEQGTCKHYRKSKRWFRFPCCNSLFPCDVCHDENTTHSSVLASKMVCGLCSVEQSIKKECGCGMSLKTQAKQFWEGGAGNRNKATLSKKDSRKFKK
ncbi:hypothetical protein ENBRE01_0843 [Enteropsectra breve]|nr:hypothetical protein ENBRE01_0843 [Enteropsectra breve]